MHPAVTVSPRHLIILRVATCEANLSFFRFSGSISHLPLDIPSFVWCMKQLYSPYQRGVNSARASTRYRVFMLLLSICSSLGQEDLTPVLFVNVYSTDYRFSLSVSYSPSVSACPPWLKMCYWFGHFLRQWQNCFMRFSISLLSLACTIWFDLQRESDEERIRNKKPKCARKQKRREKKRSRGCPRGLTPSQTSSSTSSYCLQHLQRTGHPTPATWVWAALLDYCWSPKE